MKKYSLSLLATFVLAACTLQPAHAADTKSQLIQIQTQLQLMQDNMAKMQQSFDERMGVMREMITQQTDNVNKMNTAVQNLQKSLGAQTTDAAGKVDQISGQVQALHDAVDELKARLAQVSKQLNDIQAAQQNIPQVAPGAGAPSGPGAAANKVPQAPPAEELYNDALRDFNAGKNDLASQEFSQYVQVYGNTDLAGNAQFYLADLEYRQNDFESAVRDYDKVLEQYPGGNKAPAAQLKKGMALSKLNRRSEAVKEFQSLVQRYPRSIEADQARQQLRALGAVNSARPSAATTRRRPQ